MQFESYISMMRNLFILLLLLFSTTAGAQVKYGEGTLAVGDAQGSVSILYGYDWELRKSKKFAIGIGGRFTSYFGLDQVYRTAPAKLTSGSTGPGVIFKEDIEENIDTVLMKSPQVNSLNLMINLRYRFSDKFHIGFNIDAIGFSFGGSKEGTYLNYPNGNLAEGKPTAFNILLISDNDKGSLNSEFYARYFFNEQWGVKAGSQFLFTEYTTETEVQQFPEPNDRFRNKSLMIAVGVSRKF